MTQTNSNQLTALTIQAIAQANTLAGTNVYLYAWPTNTMKNPAILFNWARETKLSNSKTVPNFTTTFVLRADIRVEDVTMYDAHTKLKQIIGQVEQAVLTNYTINSLIQQFPHIDITNGTESESEFFVAHAIMDIAFEFFQLYEPNAGVPLDTVTISVDLQNIFDATGTYVDPLFPGSGTPAPRTVGPDQRLEGFVRADNLND